MKALAELVLVRESAIPVIRPKVTERDASEN
jgi:hypothetical protein